LPPVRGGLGGVAARSSGSALAVGWTFGATGSHQRTLVALWNGAVWRTLSSRALPRESALGAAALFPGGAWAVGEKDMAENGRVFFPLMVRVTGTTVRQVPVPRTTYGGSLSDVAATSAADAWAVGFEATIGGGGGPGLILHWNGTAWTRAPLPATVRNGLFTGVAATSRTNAWAVIDPEGGVGQAADRALERPAVGRCRQPGYRNVLPAQRRGRHLSQECLGRRVHRFGQGGDPALERPEVDVRSQPEDTPRFL